jgi:hypothetical protein
MMDDQLYSRILWLMLQGDVPAHLRTSPDLTPYHPINPT